MNKSLRGTSQKALRRLAKTSRVMKNFNEMWDGSDGRDLNMEDVSNLLFNEQDKIIKDQMQLISEKEETVTLEFPQQGLTADIPIEINKDPEPHSSIHYELFESEPVDEFCQFQSDDSNSNYDTKEMLDSDDSISSDDIDTGFLDDVSNSLIASLLTTAMYLKFGLSTKALEVQLKIMKVISPSLPKEFRSTYLFLKKISNKKENLQKVFLCDICSSVMAMDFRTGNPLNRQNCGHFYSKFTHSNCYTILLPVEEQLKFFIEHHLQNSSLASKPAASVEYPEVIGDICTGAGYQEYKSNGLIDDYTVTIQLNTDGAQIHKSSKYGFWPFMGIVNETSYKTRRSNVLLFALYYGNKKPNIANFIDPVVQQLKQLSSSGIVVNGTNWKVRPIVITVDTVARPILRNTTQFNGEYGCDFCLNKGISSKKLKGHCRSYRIPSEDSPPSVMRTTTQHINDLEKLLCAQASGDMKKGERLNGIIGPSPLLELDSFDFIRSFVPDYMHAVCLGVIRYFLLLWLTSSSKLGWSIKCKIDILNVRMKAVKPPYEISRCPRTVDNISFWKASEFRAFALYYFSLLDSILPEPYYSHFCSLCYCLFVLLQESVPKSSVVKVNYLLQQFVRDTEYLYGSEHVTYNIHLLTHLSTSVLDWGCLWTHSTFIPEWFNGELVSLCNGTQKVIEQMAKSYFMKNVVRNNAMEVVSGKKVSSEVEKLLNELLWLPLGKNRSFKERKGKLVEGKAKLIGKAEFKILTIEEKLALDNLYVNLNSLAKNVDTNSHQSASPSNLLGWQEFPRVILEVGCAIFTTTRYIASPKRLNYCAFMTDGNYLFIESIVFNEGMPLPKCFVLGRVIGSQSKEVICPMPIGDVVFDYIPGQSTRAVGSDSPLVAYDVLAIFRKAVLSVNQSLTDSYVVTALPNTFESD